MLSFVNNNSVVQSLKQELQSISVIEFEKVEVKAGVAGISPPRDLALPGQDP